MPRRCNGIVLAAIRSESYPSVEKHFEIRPHIVDNRSSGSLYNALEHSQKPRRHTRYVRDIASCGLLHKGRQFLPPVSHQRNAARRHSEEIHKRVDIGYQRCRQVAHTDTARQAVELVGEAATEYEAAPAEQTAVGIEIEIERHSRRTSRIVIFPKGVGRDRYVFALAAGSAARLREVTADTRPQHVAPAAHHTHHIAPKLLIFNKGHSGGEILVSGNRAEAVADTVLAPAPSQNQPRKHSPLHTLNARRVGRTCRRQNRPAKKRTCYSGKVYHTAKIQKISLVCTPL